MSFNKGKMVFNPSKVYSYLLCLYVILIPYETGQLISYVSALLLLTSIWLLYKTADRINLYKEGKSFLLILSTFYLLQVISLLYSYDLNTGIKQLEKGLIFLILPIVMLPFDRYFKYNRDTLIALFAINVTFICCLFYAYSVIKSGSIYDYHNILFQRKGYGQVLEVHATYFSSYILLSIVFFLRKKIKWHSIPVIIFLCFNVVLFEAKTQMALLVIIALTVTFHSLYINKMLNFVSITLGLLLTFAISFSLLLGVKGIYNKYVLTFSNYSEVKREQIAAGCEVIASAPLTGVGVGDVQNRLISVYNSGISGENFEHILKNKLTDYNVHNSFLHYLMVGGPILFFTYLCIYIVGFKKSLDSRDLMFFLFLLIMIISSVTEVVLVRQKGITFYLMFYLLFSKKKSA